MNEINFFYEINDFFLALSGRCYNKSWIAMGLTFFLVIVLLIALIIVASTNSTPPRTELDCENDDRLTGYQSKDNFILSSGHNNIK